MNDRDGYGMDCPNCGHVLVFCDNGEDDEFDKKIYSCHNDKCSADLVYIYFKRD